MELLFILPFPLPHAPIALGPMLVRPSVGIIRTEMLEQRVIRELGRVGR